MRVAKLNADDLDWVVRRMRQRDREEIFATRWDDDPEKLVKDVMAGGEFGWVFGDDDGLPVAALGAIPVWNGVWEVWMFATDEWPRVSLGVHRFIKRTMIPALESVGYHRAQCRALDRHTEAHRWLLSLGAYKESELPNYGRNGETFYLFCWTRPVSRPHSETN